ncbi:MAG: transcriptional coactivator p15/PC4 family protein [Nitrospirae bacterium]|nr:transcriptional coactivator p15/PC4 family protein [Nitrospirota bacterium]
MGELVKNESEKLICQRKEYKGFPFIDVRIYFKADDGSWKPTKKGITVSPERLSDLIKLLQEQVASHDPKS